jgi:hypothetical protein
MMLFYQPPPPIPFHVLQGLLDRLDREVREEHPFQGRLSGRRFNLLTMYSV